MNNNWILGKVWKLENNSISELRCKLRDKSCKQDMRCKIWDVRCIFWAARRWERGRGWVLVSWQPHSLTAHTCLAHCKVDQQFSALPPRSGHNRQNLPSSDIDQLCSSSSQNNCQVYQDKTIPVTAEPRSAILRLSLLRLLFCLHVTFLFVRSQQFFSFKNYY